MRQWITKCRKYKKQLSIGGISAVICAVICLVCCNIILPAKQNTQEISNEIAQLEEVSEPELHTMPQELPPAEPSVPTPTEEIENNENTTNQSNSNQTTEPTPSPETVQASASSETSEPNRSGGMAKSVEVNRGSSSAKNMGDMSYLGTFRTTAYCACESCSEGWGNRTATGVPARPNHTIAVDPKVIKLGSKVVIDGKEYIAEDTGGAIKGNKIDIYFANHAEAMRFGVRSKEVYLAK